MSDKWVVGLALSIAAGALASSGVPVTVVIAAIAAVAIVRAPVSWCIAGAVTASFLGARAWQGLQPPSPGVVEGRATLVSDPVPVPGGVQVDLRVDGRRLRATARGYPVSNALAPAAAGERFDVRGVVRPLSRDARARLAPRHVAGRITLSRAARVDGGAVLARVANAARRTLVGGAGSLAPDARALYAGVVLGDDRGQDPAHVEDFRASGLAHLLAVSGQNVAFTLALAAPALRRLGLRGRLTAAIALLVLFGTVTRWEPSVLRAVGMATVTLVAATLGRPATSVRVLALASGALLLVDPLLVRSLGFGLSVAACAGIATLAPRLRAHVPDALAVTVAAQVGVFPLLVAAFGGVPVASVPANLLAAPAAGPLMVWGVAAGAVAGLAGGPVAAVLHLPTRVLLWWVAGVARIGGSIPLGRVTARAAITVLAIVLAAAALSRLARRRPGPTAAVAGALGLAVVGVVPMVRPGSATGERLDTYGDDRLWRSGHRVVVTSDGRAPPGRLLGALRERGVAQVDVLVVTRSSRSAAASVRPVLDRLPVGVVLAPAHHQVGGATTVTRVVHLRSRPFEIAVEPVRPSDGARPGGGRLRVRIGSPRAPRARSP
ncbi:MAG TPA: ComEC/Rec2 family competence protein [Acidimicrobiales bacterium]